MFVRFSTMAELCRAVLAPDQATHALLDVPITTFSSYKFARRWPRARPEVSSLQLNLAKLMTRACQQLNWRPPEHDPAFARYIKSLWAYEEYLRSVPQHLTGVLQAAAAEILYLYSTDVAACPLEKLGVPEKALAYLLLSAGARPQDAEAGEKPGPSLSPLPLLDWIVGTYVRYLSAGDVDLRLVMTIYAIQEAYVQLRALTHQRPRVPHPWYLDILLASASEVSLSVAPARNHVVRVTHTVTVRESVRGRVIVVDVE